jgi:hypothetical protein
VPVAPDGVVDAGEQDGSVTAFAVATLVTVQVTVNLSLYPPEEVTVIVITAGVNGSVVLE